jgi:hypothetical protein
MRPAVGRRGLLFLVREIQVAFQRYTTAEGWPGVRWEQVVPTGETLLSRRQELQWRFAVLLGLAVFGATLGVRFPVWWAAVASLAAALVLSSPEILRSVRIGGNGAGRAQGPSENERVLEAEARVVRFARRERRWAELVLDRTSRTLWLAVLGSDGERGRRLLFSVPLFDFDEFQLSTDEDWLGDAGTRELREMARRGACWVIVTQTASEGVLVIAQSAGDRKEMAELHRALMAAFVAGRGALKARLDEVVDDA